MGALEPSDAGPFGAAADSTADVAVRGLPLPSAVLAYLSEVPSVRTCLAGAILFGVTGYVGHRDTNAARLRAAAATTSAKALRAPPARRGP